MKELIHVCIRTSGDAPVRESVKFGTGTLLPGEVLAVERSQGELMIARNVVEEVSTAPPPPEHPQAKKKRAAKKKAAKPLAPPEEVAPERAPAADFMK